ncbi:hypothetical protein CR513_57240, partial [Mucuna pruriens]
MYNQIQSLLLLLLLCIGKHGYLEKQEIVHGIWLKKMQDEIKIPTNYTMKILCDNKAIIIIARNAILHNKIKHMEIDKHFIKEKINHDIISID